MEDSQSAVVERASYVAPGFRFPNIWGTGGDWLPDQDQIGMVMTARQRMLVQYEGDKILVLPAWPKDWNGAFKLHAPKKTTLEGKVVDGKLTELKVTPKSRRKNVKVIGQD